MKNELAAKDLPIHGMKLLSLDLRSDNRGWFEETWQTSKFERIGLSNFFPCQANVSHNKEIGTTRGMHAEPWSKLVTITSGVAFCAWVDLREGPGYKQTHHMVLKPGESVFIPKGVANGFQALAENTIYSYLVDGLWSSSAEYKSFNLFDEQNGISWPIKKDEAQISVKDFSLPPLNEVLPFEDTPILLLGSSGQVGRALASKFPLAKTLSTAELKTIVSKGELNEHVPTGGIVINAAAYTNVDDCETEAGFALGMEVNFNLVKSLASVAERKFATLVNFSTDYIFNGKQAAQYDEEGTPSPVNRYGMTKLLGDLATKSTPRHYLIRISWVYGGERNFVNTVIENAKSNSSMTVVSDQVGRLTFVDDIANFTNSLITNGSPYGTYNFSGSGESASWYQVARIIYETLGSSSSKIESVTSKEFREKHVGSSIRPANSTLNLAKASAVDAHSLKDWRERLIEFVSTQLNNQE